MAGIPSYSQQDMARDKEGPHLDVILDNQYLVLKGTGPDVDPTTLTGHVRLVLTEPTSLKEITLQFKGKAKISVLTSDLINASSSHVVCNHDWSFLQGDKKHSHTLNAGRHLFPFHLEITGSLPSSLSTSALGTASVVYKLHAIAVRTGFSHNLQTETPVFILRSLTHEALEYQQTLDIESTWPEKLMYAITLPHKAWAAGDTLTAIVKLSPLAKGVHVQAIDSLITETTKICFKGWSPENTRVVASVRHEIIDHKAVEVEVTSSAAVASGSLGTPAALGTYSPRSSRPGSPRFGLVSPSHEQQEEEDVSSDVVTCINLSIPRSSAYPFSSDATTTPSQYSSPTLQHSHLPLSTTSAASQLTSSSLSSITPSHNVEPILISHRIKWIIFIHNKDGHLSELRCSLPIIVLDGALLEEGRAFTMAARRLLLRTSGFENVLNPGGERGSGDEVDEGAGGDGEEGRIRQVEADRELPSYPAHVRDRVANMYLPDAVTMRVSNPWIGKVGPASAANRSGVRTLSTPDLSGPTDPVTADRSVSHTQSDPRASRSGHSTPAIQPLRGPVDRISYLPHAPEQSSALDWANSELFLSLSLNNKAVGGTPSIGGQQQSQPHQHSHSHNQQQSRTLRWGSRVNSRAGSRAGSPERSGLSSNNNDNGSPPEGDSSNSVVPSSSGFASPFQHLFKATIKPFTALAGHSHRPTPSRSFSTTSLTGLQSTSTAGTDISTGRPSAHTPDLPLTRPSTGANPISSSAPQNETNGFITSSPSQSLAANTTLGTSSSSFDPGLESISTCPSTSTSVCCIGVQAENQDPSSRIFRAFNVVPDYSIASRGFIGGVPPLSSMRGLPSYEEAEAQREAAQVLKDGDVERPENMKERGSMSEPDLVGRFGHFEYNVQVGNEAEVGTSGVGIMQRLDEYADGDDDDDDDDDMGGADVIQMRTKR